MTGDISKYYLFVKREFGTANKMVDDIDASTYGNNDGFLIKNEAYNYFQANVDTFEFNSSGFNDFWKTVDVERGGNVLGGNVIDLNAMNDNEIKMMEQKFKWFELLQEYMDKEWRYPNIDEKYKRYVPESNLRNLVSEALTQDILAMFEDAISNTHNYTDEEIMMLIRQKGSTHTKECSAELFWQNFALDKALSCFGELHPSVVLDDEDLINIVKRYIDDIAPGSDINTILSNLEKIILAYLDTADNDDQIQAPGMGGLGDYIYKGPYLNDLQKAVILKKIDKSFESWNEYQNAGALKDKYDWAIGLYRDDIAESLDTTYCDKTTFEGLAKFTNFIADFQQSNAYKGLEVYKRYLHPVDDINSPYYDFWNALETAVNDLLQDTGYSLDSLINEGIWAEVISTVAELYAKGGGTLQEEMPGSGGGTAPGAHERGNQTKGVCPTPAPAVPAPGVSPVIPTIDVLEGKAIIIDIINALKESLGLDGTQGGQGVDPEEPENPYEPNEELFNEFMLAVKSGLNYEKLPTFLQKICDDMINSFLGNMSDETLRNILESINGDILNVEPFKSIEMITGVFIQPKAWQNGGDFGEFTDLLYQVTGYNSDVSGWFEGLCYALWSDDTNDDSNYPIDELGKIISDLFDRVIDNYSNANSNTRGGGSGGSSEENILDIFASEIALLWCKEPYEAGAEYSLGGELSHIYDVVGSSYNLIHQKNATKRFISLLISNEYIKSDEDLQTIFQEFPDYSNYPALASVTMSTYDDVIDNISCYQGDFVSFIYNLIFWCMRNTNIYD